MEMTPKRMSVRPPRPIAAAKTAIVESLIASGIMNAAAVEKQAPKRMAGMAVFNEGGGA